MPAAESHQLWKTTVVVVLQLPCEIADIDATDRQLCCDWRGAGTRSRAARSRAPSRRSPSDAPEDRRGRDGGEFGVHARRQFHDGRQATRGVLRRRGGDDRVRLGKRRVSAHCSHRSSRRAATRGPSARAWPQAAHRSSAATASRASGLQDRWQRRQRSSNCSPWRRQALAQAKRPQTGIQASPSSRHAGQKATVPRRMGRRSLRRGAPSAAEGAGLRTSGAAVASRASAEPASAAAWVSDIAATSVGSRADRWATSTNNRG